MPAQFMALTPRELGLLAEHHAQREELVTYRLASLMANLLSPHAKEGHVLKPEDFLARPLKYIKPVVPKYPARELDKALGGMFGA